MAAESRMQQSRQLMLQQENSSPLSDPRVSNTTKQSSIEMMSDCCLNVYSRIHVQLAFPSSSAGLIFSLPDDTAHLAVEGQERGGPLHSQQDGQQLGRRLQRRGEHEPIDTLKLLGLL